ncbi:MAG TPA: hypothetical protein PK385_00265 [Spirochaetota bacterium]|nr:hypothetical protein [Spirochaetota bacterium]HOS31884.1 hypothetical protein [Spirochaetota bacterium]HOS54471.1 hypothetical protein [Spirochaetota bacterium]HQF76964.1 hypothetical protein [Spirochaetota bacterium]HQH31569.1 hypothetical protein [Spirochaetota bacterium]
MKNAFDVLKTKKEEMNSEDNKNTQDKAFRLFKYCWIKDHCQIEDKWL